MASFRESAVPATCAECGAHVLVPQGRPGVRLKCPKCGSVLRAPSTGVSKPAGQDARPLESVPTAALAPSNDIAAEIDALLFADLPTTIPPTSKPAESPSHTIPPTEVPPPPCATGIASAEAPHTGVVAFDAPQDAPPDADEYKLSADLGALPLPPPLPPTAFSPPPHAPHPARGEHEFRLGVQHDLPEVAGSRMQHIIDAEMSDDNSGHGGERYGAERHGAIGDRLLKRKGERFTPDAMLADPRRAFLRGVFEFPCYLDVMPQWIKLAFTLTLELTLAWWIVATMKMSSGGGFWDGGGIAIGSLLMLAPAILFGFIWIAMTWAVGSAIIEDTAAGMNHIENWPESLVLDDLPSLIFPAMALFLSALPAAGIDWLSKNGLPQIWFLMPIPTLLLFPFVLLSILETGSVFIPFSLAIFRCVYKRPGTWIWFYVESTAIVAVAAGLSTLLWWHDTWTHGSMLRIALAAVLSTAAILIYFRLLGRLALVCANQAYDWTEEAVAEAEADEKDEFQHSVDGRSA